MVSIMAKNENLEKKNLQLGAVDRDLVLEFRRLARERNLNQIDTLRKFVQWWNDLDIEDQKDFFHYPANHICPPIIKKGAHLERLEKAICEKMDCLHCAFFFTYIGKEGIGECRRCSPSGKIVEAQKNRAKVEIENNVVFPIVEFGFWCGQFQATRQSEIANRLNEADAKLAKKFLREAATSVQKGRLRKNKTGKSSKSG